jgi:hypothetical protein
MELDRMPGETMPERGMMQDGVLEIAWWGVLEVESVWCRETQVAGIVTGTPM